MGGELKKHINVTCAVIVRDGRVLAAQRSVTMSMPLKWEFPGGKVDDGESLEACLLRELVEELGIFARIVRALPPNSHDYPSFAITLNPFICEIDSGEITLHEHAAINWLSPREMLTLDWAEADIPIVQGVADLLAAYHP